MNPKYSEEDRYKIVTNFIALRGQGKIRIVDFSPLIRYFDDIKPLKEIKKTMKASRGITYFPINGFTKEPEVLYYGSEDAEEYFNWLIWILSADEKATDETRKEAVSQLFLFIFALKR